MLTNNDVDTQKKAISAESSTDQKTDSNSSEAEQTQNDELGSGSKKFDERFKEIYRQKKELERENEELKKAKADDSDDSSDFIPATWSEVFEKVETRLTQKQSQKEKEIEEQLGNVNKQIADLKSLHPDIDEEKLWKYMEENKSLNVYEAFAKTKPVEKRDNASKKVAEKMGGQSATSKSAMSYAELHAKSLDDI